MSPFSEFVTHYAKEGVGGVERGKEGEEGDEKRLTDRVSSQHPPLSCGSEPP